MQALDHRSDVDLRSAFPRSFIRYRPIRFGFLEFAAAVFRADRLSRTFAGGVSADAFVPRALCDERSAGLGSCDSSALSLFASAKEDDTACIAICLARIGDWRCNVNESDRNFVTASDRRGNRREARLHACANRNLVA